MLFIIWTLLLILHYIVGLYTVHDVNRNNKWVVYSLVYAYADLSQTVITMHASSTCHKCKGVLWSVGRPVQPRTTVIKIRCEQYSGCPGYGGRKFQSSGEPALSGQLWLVPEQIMPLTQSSSNIYIYILYGIAWTTHCGQATTRYTQKGRKSIDQKSEKPATVISARCLSSFVKCLLMLNYQIGSSS